jgi:hypothetical protein
VTHESDSGGTGADSHLVQLLIPLRDNAGNPFPASHYAALREDLAKRFGGVTAYTRAPAEGTWETSDESRARDDIVVYEVMVDHLDRDSWAEYRRSLEKRFAQEELVVRAQRIERL